MCVKKIIILILLSLTSSEVTLAKENRFFGYHLPPPPAPGTDAFDQDFIKLHEYQDHRTPEQCEEADAQSKLSLENAFGPSTGVLTAAEVKKAKVLSMRILAKASIAVLYYKSKFKRVRPYNVDSTLIPCIHKPPTYDVSYPSGHSTSGYALALALAKKFPAKRDLILKQGLQIGENRLIGGVHHPSDVEAGRMLAEQVVKHMIITRE